MGRLKTKVIYEVRDINKIKNKLPYYRDLGVDTISIDLETDISKTYLRELFALKDFLLDENFILMVRVDVARIGGSLLGKKTDLDFYKDSQVRRAFYAFINFLVKRGIGGFDFKNIYGIAKDLDPYSFINMAREINKNARALNKDLITIAYLRPDHLSYRKFIMAKGISDFTYLYTDKFDINNIDPYLAYKEDTEALINQNYPYEYQSARVGAGFLLNGPIIIREGEEVGLRSGFASTFDLVQYMDRVSSFYKKIISLKKSNKIIERGRVLRIFKREEGILAFTKTYKKDKALVIINLSQKEVLLNTKMYLPAYDSYKFVLSNYDKRAMVDPLVIRAYEVVVFLETRVKFNN
ncbi:MAG: hypothetical protein SOU08_02950 [Anaerococcus sp.]|nr:hypothetical protein [Peptoniphilaceae bacterium]MDY2918580.1 hypothetical protein [Anaerococcus sp.]